MKKEKKRKNNKNIIYICIGIISVLLVIMICFFVGLNYLNKSNNNDNNEEKKVDTIELIDLTTNGMDEIKNHIVRVTNTIKDKDKIVGSGFFISSGYLVTNSHVVDIEGEITILYSDGKTSKAKIVSNDIVSDVAILSVEEINAKAMNFGNTLNVKVAEDLYAVGYGLDLTGDASVTKGILSARRSMAGIEYLQTDAAINSGFSGGPLLTKDGYVVGINSLANDNATIGMAISSESLQNVINKLIEDKDVTYLTTDRPVNALSSVLKEVGYDIEDIYDEWKYFHDGEKKEEHKEEKPNNNVQVYHPSGNCNLKDIIVEGYELNWNRVDQKFQLYLYNDESSLNVRAIPEHSKATVKIEGQNDIEYFGDHITITVTAEDPAHTKQYWINVHRLKPTIEGLKSISVSGGPSMNNGKKVFGISWSYYDNDMLNLSGTTAALSSANASIYVCSVGTDCSGNNRRLINSYNVFPDDPYGSSKSLPFDKIKNAILEEEYDENGQAKIVFDLTIVTKSDGTHQASGNSIINK